MARIKIDVANGIFEAEGDEKFLSSLYADFKQGLAQAQKQLMSSGENLEKKNTPGDANGDKKASKTANRRKESYSIVKDLDLSSKDGKRTLRGYYTEKQPSTGMERATMFVYYLKKFAGIDSISPDHIYTCYKEVGVPVPKALKQSLLDTAFRKGSIDTSDLNNITLTTVGENMVEYDLPTKKEDK
jgi:hypothetical protein